MSIESVLSEIENGEHATSGRQFGQGMAHAAKLIRAEISPVSDVQRIMDVIARKVRETNMGQTVAMAAASEAEKLDPNFNMAMFKLSAGIITRGMTP